MKMRARVDPPHRRACSPGGRAERELSAELESHLQLHIDDNLRAGMTPEEARRPRPGQARRRRVAPRRRIAIAAACPVLESLVRDLRYGARTLRQEPRASPLAGIVILGLGIGVNSAIFTVVNAVVLRPLPFPDADRIVRLWHTPPQSTFPGMRTFSLSPANFLDWEAQSALVRGDGDLPRRAADADRPGRADGGAAACARRRASCRSSGCSRSSDAASRPTRTATARPPTVLLSEGFWRTRFGADPAIVGQPILLNLTPYTVVGVVPAPSFLEEVQVWTPLAWTPDDRAERANHNYRARRPS